MQRSIKIQVIWKICRVDNCDNWHATIGMFEICSVYVTIGMLKIFGMKCLGIKNDSVRSM